ncbi:alanine racemase [Filimonas lacunae]|uniref:Alanine racemase n=1 Tax=Filimonas lacunae TaxID=477680 RepID=A0A173MMW3_9BACT|nr:bifunctional UDP-N-acetylmuramoyl-tripeptide:D-alanyl-D-alanine ligase/alanine racemase [Filimonas lacunae]BAV08995.1 alanine racemase [Filimonas lacunae]SIS65459.1 alanine racemase [Filimonas lacunae]
MEYTIEQIAALCGGQLVKNRQVTEKVQYLVTDSRRISFPATSLFIALKTSLRDGHQFLADVYQRGVRSFMVQHVPDAAELSDADYIVVPDSLQAMQQLAAKHRQQFTYPVIGITGSNGKTIVKEWLYQLLHDDFNIVRSPRSYNSQIGVPLSVWQMNSQHTLGIFEAGISQPGEMAALESVIGPTIGLLTNIGEAHSEGFASIEEKLLQKLLLFKHAHILFCNTDDERVAKAVANSGLPLFTIGSKEGNALHITGIEQEPVTTVTDNAVTAVKAVAMPFVIRVTAIYKGSNKTITIPFTDTASIQNAIACWAVMLYLEIEDAVIAKRIAALQQVDMRLQMVEALNNCAVINDSYSFDITSFTIAIEFLQQQNQYLKRTVILSDLPAFTAEENYGMVAQILEQKQIDRIITIGSKWQGYARLLAALPARVEQYASTDVFLQQVSVSHFRNEAILLKGARVFAFERIAAMLSQQVHKTVMEINLTALAHNLKQYQQRLQPGTRLMAMVKAFGYGSGSAEVANVLQFHKVDYLAVAYADEAVDLRKAGISLPILVMNVDEAAFDTIVEYNLEPELFSFPILKAFLKFLQQQGLQQYPVHIKLDTGMHRLGFEEPDMPALINILQQQQEVVVTSVFSHLTSSEDPNDDEFTHLQATRFERCCALLKEGLGYSFIRHLSNSAAIFRLPELQYDMVRLGIGLYGVDSANEHQLSLQTVGTLNTTIAQLRKVKAGETVSYNRKGKITRDSLIATLRIGYADGYNRRLGYGRGKVWVKGQLVPVVGTVCMDMMMVDVTDVPGVTENDIVEVFGAHLPVQQVAAWSETIAYEILTSVGQRIKRVYIEE